MKNLFLLIILCFCQFYIGMAQETAVIKWWNPEEATISVIEGKGWIDGTETFYDRLPKKAKKTVRKAVWNLSKHSAGMMIRFKSNSKDIKVRYTVSGNHGMNHMPATGVTGIDLYAVNTAEDWLWCRGRRHFGDTIQYNFLNLVPAEEFKQYEYEYRLYLPLYNHIKWLEIGINAESDFEFLGVRKEKPIVVYGTSIAQGACASRPGMAWTNILGRKLNTPIINLAFSGNGRLEKELIDLLVEIDAKIYVLDCLPNLHDAKKYSNEEIKNRLLSSIKRLKKERPNTPILLTEHAGYTDGFIDPLRGEAYTRVNAIQMEIFNILKKEGIQMLYYLPYNKIGLDLDDMVDGTHPNDLGMMDYAEAYEKIFRTLSLVETK